MSKRFTETTKWDQDFFSNLSLKMKLVWIYICDKCDHAGIWDLNLKLLSFQISEQVTLHEIQSSFLDKVEVFGNKLLIKPFIEFQYGELRDNNSVHVSIINRLQKLGVELDVKSGYSNRPSAVAARLSQKMKNDIIASDLFLCSYCGNHGDQNSLVVDHIVPRSKGGDNSIGNLTTSCASCNSKKSDLSVDYFLSKNSLENSISEKLKNKIALLRSLNGPFKDLNRAKDKDKDKDKDKEKETDFFRILNSTLLNHTLLTRSDEISIIETFLKNENAFGNFAPPIFQKSKSKVLATLVHVYGGSEFFRADLNAIINEKNTEEKIGFSKSDYILARLKNKALELHNAT